MSKKFIQKTVLIGILFIFIGSTLTIINANASGPAFPIYTGTVTDTNGNPISSASVRLLSNGAQVNIDYTDSNGDYSVGNDIVNNGQIEVSKTDYYTQTKSVDSDSYNFYLVAIPSYEPEPPTYTGTVTDADGNSIQYALVRLLSNGAQVNTDSTDSNGNYCVGNDVVTLGQIEVSKAGYNNQTKSVGEHGGENIDFPLSLLTYIDFSGQVTDNSGIELDGVYVILVDNEGSVIDRIETHDGGYFYFRLLEENSLCTLYTYHTDYYSTEHSVLLNADQEINFEITLKPDRDDNIGQNFDDQYVGETPSSWLIRDSDNCAVEIENTIGNGLRDYIPGGKLVKFSCAGDGYKHASIEKKIECNNNLATTTLISFKAAFNSNSNDNPNNYGYFQIDFTNGLSASPFIIKISKTDIILYRSGRSAYEVIHSSPIDKKQYQFDIVLEQNENLAIDYNIYIDGELLEFGCFDFYDLVCLSISQLSFGLCSFSQNEFYIDNIHFEQPNVDSVENNLHLYLAHPLCWLFAPEVADVISYYKITKEVSTSFKVSVFLGIPLPYTMFLSINVFDLFEHEDSSKTEFAKTLWYDCEDVFLHIRNDFLYNKKAIKLKGSDSIYLETINDFNHVESKYKTYTKDFFNSTYGYIPADPRENGLEPSSITSYSQTGITDGSNSGTELVPGSNNERIDKDSYSIGLSVGKGIKIGFSLTFSTAVRVETHIQVDVEKDICIEYGVPIDHGAYLGVQPYIVRPNPAVDSPPPEIIPKPIPELPPSDPDKPDPIDDPTPPPTKPPMPPFVR